MEARGPDCPNTDVLAAFLAGTLQQQALSALETHLASCDECLNVVAHANGALTSGADLGTGTVAGASLRGVGGDRFEVGHLIAKGGMGAVYHGVDRSNGRPVAIKRLHADAAARHHQSAARFQREAELLAKADHPNMVRLVATVDRAGEVDLVMEYAPGGSLRDILSIEPQLPVARALPWLLELTDAVVRAHHLGIIHRDIKPENVLLNAAGAPCLSDFGLARSGDAALTSSGVLLGTLPYLSPELLRGCPASEADDLWALGVVAYEMLAGHRPFRGPSFAAIANAILNAPEPDLRSERPELPPELGAFVARLLRKDPALRFPSARALGAELESVRRLTLRSDAVAGPATPTPAPPPPSAEAAVAPAPSTSVVTYPGAPGTSATWPPARIATLTALLFGLAGAAIWAVGTRGRHAPFPALARGLISNFESGQVKSEFGYGWIPTLNPPATSNSALSVVPGGASGSGWALAVRGVVGDSGEAAAALTGSARYAGAYFNPGAIRNAPANLSSKAGLAFSVKGDGRAYDVVFFTGRSLGSQARSFQTDADWRRHEIRFEDLPGFESTTVTGIWFGSQRSGPVAFELDDVQLF